MIDSIVIRKTVTENARSYQQHARRRTDTLLFWIYCMGSAFDFKGKAGGGAIPIALFVMSTLSFIFMVVRSRRLNLWGLESLKRVTLAWLVYLLASLFVAIYWNIPLENYIRTCIPSLLMAESMIIALIIFSASDLAPDLLMRGVFWSCLISTFVYFVNGLFFLGLTLDTARYTITSPLIASLFTISCWLFLWVQGRRRFLYLFSLIVSASIMYLSLTRTYLAVLAVALLAFLPIIAMKPSWYTSKLRATTKQRAIALAIALFIASGTLLIVFPSFATRWTSRTSAISETDPSALSRVAEAAGELEKMQSSAARFVIGSGIGSEHVMDNIYLKDVAAWEGDDSINDAIYEVGHVLWPYQFYATGIFLGWTVPIILVAACWNGIRSRASYLPFIAASAIIGVIVQSTSGNLLGARSGGAILGLLIGIACADRRVAAN